MGVYCCFVEVTSCVYLCLLHAGAQLRPQLVDDGILLSDGSVVSLLALLLMLLDVPAGITYLLQLQKPPPLQQLQALTHTHTITSVSGR